MQPAHNQKMVHVHMMHVHMMLEDMMLEGLSLSLSGTCSPNPASSPPFTPSLPLLLSLSLAHVCALVPRVADKLWELLHDVGGPACQQDLAQKFWHCAHDDFEKKLSELHTHMGKLVNYDYDPNFPNFKGDLEETLLWKLSEPRSDRGWSHTSETERVFSRELFSNSASVFESGWCDSLLRDPALAGDEHAQRRTKLEKLARDLVPVLARMRVLHPRVAYEWSSIAPVGEGVSGGESSSNDTTMVCFDKERHQALDALDGMPAEGQEVRIFFPALVWASDLACDRVVVKETCRARVLST